MKLCRLKKRLGKLFLTETVACIRGGRWTCVAAQNGEAIEPILICRDAAGHALILDGNQRACCCLRHKRTLGAYVVTGDHDAEAILRLEAARTIRPFPHRDFLMGTLSFRSLLNEIEVEVNRLGRRTVAAAVATF
jgi:hypothetical protein